MDHCMLIRLWAAFPVLFRTLPALADVLTLIYSLNKIQDCKERPSHRNATTAKGDVTTHKHMLHAVRGKYSWYPEYNPLAKSFVVDGGIYNEWLWRNKWQDDDQPMNCLPWIPVLKSCSARYPPLLMVVVGISNNKWLSGVLPPLILGMLDQAFKASGMIQLAYWCMALAVVQGLITGLCGLRLGLLRGCRLPVHFGLFHYQHFWPAVAQALWTKWHSNIAVAIGCEDGGKSSFRQLQF